MLATVLMTWFSANTKLLFNAFLPNWNLHQTRPGKTHRQLLWLISSFIVVFSCLCGEIPRSYCLIITCTCWDVTIANNVLYVNFPSLFIIAAPVLIIILTACNIVVTIKPTECMNASYWSFRYSMNNLNGIWISVKDIFACTLNIN